MSSQFILAKKWHYPLKKEIVENRVGNKPKRKNVLIILHSPPLQTFLSHFIPFSGKVQALFLEKHSFIYHRWNLRVFEKRIENNEFHIFTAKMGF